MAANASQQTSESIAKIELDDLAEIMQKSDIIATRNLGTVTITTMRNIGLGFVTHISVAGCGDFISNDNQGPISRLGN